MGHEPMRHVVLALMVLAGAGCGGAGGSESERADAALSLSPPTTLVGTGARNPTAAVDPGDGAVYVAWAQESPDTAPAGAGRDPVVQVMVARSDDRGTNFSPPVLASGADEHIQSYPVAPARVAVARDGTLLVLYRRAVPFDDRPELSHGLRSVRLVRSTDGGRTFSAPVDVGTTEVEGVESSKSMHNVLVAGNGDVLVSWLDFRAEEEALRRGSGLIGDQGHDEAAEEPSIQLRVARSGDAGLSFAPSVVAAERSCDCCGTHLAAGDGVLYAGTRSKVAELKNSYDDVRDVWVAASSDGGATWGAPVKVHDDGFKISGCPDVTGGLAVDSTDRLHAAWYTGTDRRPGYFYATSDDRGRTFSEPLTLLTDKWIPYGDLKLVIDREDRPWVAFEDRRGDVDKVRVMRIGPDGKMASTRSFTGTAPDLTLRDGVPLVVWHAAEGEGGGSVSLALVRD